MKTRLRLINKSFLLKESNIQFIGKITKLDKNVWCDEEGNLTVLDEFKSEDLKRESIEDLYETLQENRYPFRVVDELQ